MPPEIRNLLSVPLPIILLNIGTQEINTRASIYRTGTRITVSGTNTIMAHDGHLCFRNE
jgi:hypothetical protein